MNKPLTLTISILCILTLTNITSASTTDILQPASTITYNEDLTVNGTGRFDSVYIGKTTGEGGVTFFNGTMINNSEGNVPLTMGDDLRVDGMIWRGPSKGTSDDMGLKFADSLWPALDNANDIGTSELQFKDAYFAGNVTVGNLLGSGIIDYSNLATSNTGSANQLLSYNGTDLEWITVGTSSSNDTDDTSTITVGDITGVTTATGSGLTGGGTSGTVSLSVSGVTSSMITDGTITGDDLSDDYVNVSGDTMSGALVVNNTLAVNSDVVSAAILNVTNDALNGGAVSGTSTGVGGVAVYGNVNNTSGDSYAGRFTVNSTTGRAVYGTGTATTGENYGGYFQSSSSGGRGAYGYTTGSSGYAVMGYATGTSGRGVHGAVTGSDAIAISGLTTNNNARSGNFYGGDFRVTLGNDDGTNYFRITDADDGGNGLPTGGASVDVQIESATGDLVYVPSSRRYKENIEDLSVNTADVLELNPVSFNYKESGYHDIGLIAENVNELIPDLVSLDKDGLPEGVKYDRVSVYLLEVIKEQQNEVNNLKEIICNKYPEEDICE